MRLDLEKSAWRQQFWPWLIRGALFPCFVWAVANVGLGRFFPPLLPAIADAQDAKAPWAALWMAGCLYGWILILSWWCAVTYCWMLFVMGRQAPDRAEWFFNVCVVGVLSIACAVALYLNNGISGLGAAIALAAVPIVHLTFPLARMPVPRAFYGRATAQLNFGKPAAAEQEIIAQLEKVENDFEGWMMLAEVYARQFRNIEDAARVVLDICQDPASQPLQISIACNKLADWQLEIADNAEAARAALELLCRKTAGTHFASMAKQRLKNMPRDSAELAESRKPRTIRLLPVSEESPETQPHRPAMTERGAAAREANFLSEQLGEDPNDVSLREKLAFVLAEKLGKTELGIEQLTLLTEMPDPEDEQKAKWTAQIASWRFSMNNNREQFRSELQELVRRFPQTAQAFAAQRRLFLMESSPVLAN
jgi:hypothetical protein